MAIIVRNALVRVVTRVRRYVVAVVPLVLVALVPLPPAHAYCASPVLKWNTSTLHVNTSSFIPSGWTSALSASASQWNGIAGANWTLKYHSYNNSNTSGEHVYLYRFGDAPPPGFGGAPAMTALVYSGGEITGGNIFFNSAFTWNTSDTLNQAQKKADVRTVAVHELGHEVYLNHPSACGTVTSAEKAAAMHPNWTTKWYTKSDDKAGLAVRK